MPTALTRAAATAAVVLATVAIPALPAGAHGEPDGLVTPVGDAADHGQPPHDLVEPVVDIAATPSGAGYWLVASDGGVFAFGDAGFFGSTGGMTLNAPIVAMTVTGDGAGYWFVASDGGVFAFGDAGFFGSTGGMTLNAPIVSMTATPSGEGYWLVASDGGVFAFGDAGFFGSTGGTDIPAPITDLAATSTGAGYWMVGADGTVHAFGDAVHHGDAAGSPERIVGIVPTRTDGGYWLVGVDGAIHAFGDASPIGEQAPPEIDGREVVGLDARPDGRGWWLASAPEVVVAEAATPTDWRDPYGWEVWDRLAQCESGGNWSINTGNGYYGGLQFALRSWRAVGGTGYPHQHPRETQIEMGRRLWEIQGWGAWPACSRKLGLR